MDLRQLRLTDYEPIDALWLRMELTDWGWNLTVGHRHRCGQYSDCETEEYAAMSIPEALDVVAAILLTIGHSD